MENTAKNFALQIGSLISLYISVTALITLLFGVITILYPDAANGYWEQEGAASSIRIAIAMLVVFFPAYIALTRTVNVIRRTESGMYLTLTKWLIYLSLLLGGALILGDLVMIINAFLNGELTVRFALKALVFLIVVGGAFAYYLFDAKGYWQNHEAHSIRYGGVALVIVVLSLVAGLAKIETPGAVREMKIDAQQAMDLMNIQSHIEAYAYQNEKLPKSIDEAFSGVAIPTAPSERSEYVYEITGEDTYDLCADFAYESEPGQEHGGYMYDYSRVPVAVSWEHGAGEWCYERTLPPTDPLKL